MHHLFGAAGLSTDTELFAALSIMTTLVGLLGVMSRRFRQPPVIGEILAGVALGPCVLGLLPGHPLDHVFTGAVRDLIDGLGQVGLVCYLFGVGRELDIGRLRRNRTSVVAVASAATLTPLVLGLAVGVAIGPWTPHHDRSSLAAALAVALSVTAVPVLARTVSERNMTGSQSATVSLAAAAMGDVASWTLLAVVIAVYRPLSSGWPGMPLVGLVVLVALAVLVGRPLLRLAMTSPTSASWPLASRAAIVGAMLFAVSAGTSLIGLHSVFGALIVGLVAPRPGRSTIESVLPDTERETGLARVDRSDSVQRIVTATGTLFLPAFFVSSGLKMAVPQGSPGHLFALLALLTVVAVAAKLFPAAGAARLSSVPTKESWRIGILMNCRGLTELVILSVLLAGNIINPSVYTVLIFVSLITTLVTAPLLGAVDDDRHAVRRLLPFVPSRPASSAASPARSA